MRKILILGSSGFIGKNLSFFFKNKKQFKCFGTYLKNYPKILKNKIILKKVDLKREKEVSKLFKEVKPDIVIQAAATTSGAKDIVSKPFIHVNDNAIINSVVTKACFDNQIKHFIFFSCTVMYKASKKYLKEKDFNANEEMYPNYFGAGWMKIFVEKLCEFYSRISDTKFTIIRHSNIYGPHDKYDLEKSHVFGATITKVMTAKKNIVIWGEGSESRDLLHVDDLMNFVFRSIGSQKKKFNIYNVGSSKNISIKNLAEKIIRHSGKKVDIKFDLSKKSLNNSVKINIAKSKKDIGWVPKISIDSGIKKTINWYKHNFK